MEARENDGTRRDNARFRKVYDGTRRDNARFPYGFLRYTRLCLACPGLLELIKSRITSLQ